MSARATHNVVATIGEYTDLEGNKKKRYMNVGVCFTNDQGQQSIKLNALPVTPDWSGFLSLYPKETSSNSGNQQRPSAEPQRQQPPHHSQIDAGDGDDLPF